MIIWLASYPKSGNTFESQNILDENTIKILSTEFKEEMKELNYL